MPKLARTPPTSLRDQSWPKIAALAVSVSLGVGTVLASSINLGNYIEFGAGVENTDLCASTPITSFEQDFVTTMSGQPSRITRILVEGIPISCAGQYLRLTISNSTSQPLETIVWSLQKVADGDTSINAIADGDTITNSSSDNISLIYPASETDPLGLSLESLDPAEISVIELVSSENLLSE